MLIPLEAPRLLTAPYFFSVAWDAPSDMDQIPDIGPLPERLSAATPTRIAEFTAGRFCAAKAIEAIRPHWTGRVGMNPDGSPLWPCGLVGSITHTQGFAAAVVAPSDTWQSVGIDSEKATDANALEAAGRIVINKGEHRLSARLPISEHQFILLIFSAKESIYKCLYPLLKRPHDFSKMVLEDIDFQKRTFQFHISDPIEPGVLSSFGAQGRFEFMQGCVHTGVELAKDVP